MVISLSPLPKNNGNSFLPFFGTNYPIFLLDHIYLLIYKYINWFTWVIFSHDCKYYTKIRGNYNSPNSLNVTVNCHYQSENRVITQYFPYIIEGLWEKLTNMYRSSPFIELSIVLILLDNLIITLFGRIESICISI